MKNYFQLGLIIIFSAFLVGCKKDLKEEFAQKAKQTFEKLAKEEDMSLISLNVTKIDTITEKNEIEDCISYLMDKCHKSFQILEKENKILELDIKSAKALNNFTDRKEEFKQRNEELAKKLDFLTAKSEKIESLDKKSKNADNKKLLYYQASISLKFLNKDKTEEKEEGKMLFSKDRNVVSTPEFYKRAAKKYGFED